jgi:predicted nuclease of restriction endonuclease-like (RecB) superfamily
LGDITIYLEAVKKIKNAILQRRYRVAVNANAELLSLYYSVGRYTSDNTRSGKWGTKAIEEISKLLQSELPGLRGFSATNIRNMRIFYEEWVQTLEPIRQLATDESNTDMENIAIHQLPTDELRQNDLTAFLRTGFTHHIEIISKRKSPDERWYYIKRCAAEFWTVLSLRDHLRRDDYHTFGRLPNNFKTTIRDDKLAVRAVRSFKDNYLLDFVDIHDADDYDEREVEDEIVKNVKQFIMSCGDGFCFIANQYRVIISDEEFFIDLLFFNRNLQCLVAFELKRENFTPGDLGQLNFYLSALDEYVKKPWENKSIGILLCKKMNKSIVELAVRDYGKPVGVATYRFDSDMPDEYQSLKSVIDGVRQILDENNSSKENDVK